MRLPDSVMSRISCKGVADLTATRDSDGVTCSADTSLYIYIGISKKIHRTVRGYCARGCRTTHDVTQSDAHWTAGGPQVGLVAFSNSVGLWLTGAWIGDEVVVFDRG